MTLIGTKNQDTLPIHVVWVQFSSCSPWQSSCGTLTNLCFFSRFLVVGASSGIVPSRLQKTEHELHSIHCHSQVFSSEDGSLWNSVNTADFTSGGAFHSRPDRPDWIKRIRVYCKPLCWKFLINHQYTRYSSLTLKDDTNCKTYLFINIVEGLTSKLTITILTYLLFLLFELFFHSPVFVLLQEHLLLLLKHPLLLFLNSWILVC